MKLNLSTVIISLLITSQCMGGATFHGSEQALKCSKSLEKILNKVVKNENPEVFIGSFNELERLMSQSGAPQATVDEVKSLYNKIIKAGKRNIIGEVYETLVANGEDPSKFVMCFLGTGCKLARGSGVSISNVEFDMLDDQIDSHSEDDSEQNSSSSEENTMKNTIIVKGGPKIDPAFWTLNFIHETTHYMDSLILNNWIKANIALIESKRKPDRYFEKYVLYHKDKIPGVNMGFFRAYLESRAYRAQALAFKFAFPQMDFVGYEKRKKEIGYTNLRRSPMGIQVLDENHVTERDFLKFGETVEKVIQNTIALALSIK